MENTIGNMTEVKIELKGTHDPRSTLEYQAAIRTCYPVLDEDLREKHRCGSCVEHDGDTWCSMMLVKLVMKCGYPLRCDKCWELYGETFRIDEQRAK